MFGAGGFGQSQGASSGASGSNSTPAAGGFGSTTAATGSGSFGGFGATPSATRSVSFAGGTSTSGGFGSSSSGGASSSAFGGGGTTGTSSAFGASSTPASGGFGASSTPSAAGFGTTNTLSLVNPSAGQTQTTAPSSGGFGSTQSTAGAGGFGAMTSGFGGSAANSGAFGSSSFGGGISMSGQAPGMAMGTGLGMPNAQLQQQGIPNSREGFEGELSRIAEMKKQYAPIQVSADGNPHGLHDVDTNLNSNRVTSGPFPWNEDCAFKFTIYPPKDSAGHYLRFREEYLDSVAVERNPDPDRLVPRTLMGSTELINRYKSQNSESSRMFSELEKIKSTQIGPIRHEQSQLSVKFRQFKDKHNEQARRLTKILRDVEVLRNRGRPLHNDEIKHREEYDRAIVIKNGFEGKLSQLESLTQGYAQDVSNNMENEHYEDISDMDLQTIYELLSRQHEGIVHLTNILEKDIRDVEIMSRGMR